MTLVSPRRRSIISGLHVSFSSCNCALTRTLLEGVLPGFPQANPSESGDTTLPFPIFAILIINVGKTALSWTAMIGSTCVIATGAPCPPWLDTVVVVHERAACGSRVGSMQTGMFADVL